MSIFSLYSPSSRKRGFTLIELLVTLSIMMVITTLLLIRQSHFDSSTLLRSLAYSVALSVRQAQTYGGSVLGTVTAKANCTGYYDTTSGACYASGYGIHLTAGNLGSYTLFADLNSNGVYDASPVDEAVKVFSFNSGYGLSQVCVNQISPSAQICFPGGLTTLDIMFRRPNPDACFSSDATANAGGPTACIQGGTQVYKSASIQVQNSGDPTNTRNVCIYQSGQIAVEPPATACP